MQLCCCNSELRECMFCVGSIKDGTARPLITSYLVAPWLLLLLQVITLLGGKQGIHFVMVTIQWSPSPILHFYTEDQTLLILIDKAVTT